MVQYEDTLRGAIKAAAGRRAELLARQARDAANTTRVRRVLDIEVGPPDELARG